MGTEIISNTPPQFPLLTTQITYADLLSYALTNTDTLVSHLTSNIITSSSNSNPRTIMISLNKRTLMLVEYYPSVLETFKFKWSRFLAFAIVFYYLLSTLQKVLLKEGLLDSQSVVEKVK